MFVPAGYSPTSSSLVHTYINAGFAYKGVFESREDDTLGASVGQARISRDARRADKDRIYYSGMAMPVRSAETVYQVTYQAVVVPGFTVQPEFPIHRSPGRRYCEPKGWNWPAGQEFSCYWNKSCNSILLLHR